MRKVSTHWSAGTGATWTPKSSNIVGATEENPKWQSASKAGKSCCCPSFLKVRDCKGRQQEKLAFLSDRPEEGELHFLGASRQYFLKSWVNMG